MTRPHGASALLRAGVVAALVALTGCGDDSEEATVTTTATTSSTSAPAATTTLATAPSSMPAPSTSTTRPRATTTTTAGGPTSTAAATTTTAPPATTAAIRVVALRSVFSIRAGEAVSVEGTDLALTFIGVTSDNRCPPAVQCIVAGSATIHVQATVSGVVSNLMLSTDVGSDSAAVGGRRVTLVQLGYYTPATARLAIE